MNDHITFDIEVLQQQRDYHKNLADTWYYFFNEAVSDFSLVLGIDGEKMKIIDYPNLKARPEILELVKAFIQEMFQYHKREFELLDNKLIELHHFIAGTTDA